MSTRMTADTMTGSAAELDAIGRRLDDAGAAWAEAGYRYDGPEAEAREAAFTDLRAWNAARQARRW